MSVTFNPSAPTTTPSQPSIEGADDDQPVNCFGNAGFPSTLVSFQHSSCCDERAPIVGMFHAIANAVKSYFHETPLETRVKNGKKLLIDHFDSFWLNNDPIRTAVVIVMEYNNQTKMIITTRRDLDESNAIEQLRQFLSHADNKDCDDGSLNVRTLHIEKKGGGLFEMTRHHTLINFGKATGPEISWKDEDSEAIHFQTANLTSKLKEMITSEEDCQKVLDFVRTLAKPQFVNSAFIQNMPRTRSAQ